MSIHGYKEEAEELGYVRLGIILSTDTISKLDALKNQGMLANRSRTVQALVDEVWEMRKDSKQLMKIFQEYSETNPGNTITKMTFWLMDIVRRLYVFGVGE
jgi:hypothetical protein